MAQFGLEIGMKEAKAMFFDRSKVQNATDKTTRRVFSQFGAFVRRDARKSMRKPRMMKISEMDQDQVEAFRLRQRMAEQQGKPKPKRPLAPSKPGTPPRVITGLIKKLILFGYDSNRRTVVIGPVRTNAKGSDVPEVLEQGGRSRNWRGKKINVEARPFMGPAFEKNEPKLPGMWADSIT